MRRVFPSVHDCVRCSSVEPKAALRLFLAAGTKTLDDFFEPTANLSRPTEERPP